MGAFTIPGGLRVIPPGEPSVVPVLFTSSYNPGASSGLPVWEVAGATSDSPQGWNVAYDGGLVVTPPTGFSPVQPHGTGTYLTAVFRSGNVEYAGRFYVFGWAFDVVLNCSSYPPSTLPIFYPGDINHRPQYPDICPPYDNRNSFKYYQNGVPLLFPGSAAPYFNYPAPVSAHVEYSYFVEAYIDGLLVSTSPTVTVGPCIPPTEPDPDPDPGDGGDDGGEPGNGGDPGNGGGNEPVSCCTEWTGVAKPTTAFVSPALVATNWARTGSCCDCEND